MIKSPLSLFAILLMIFSVAFSISEQTIFHPAGDDTVIAEVEESIDEETNQPIIVINLPDLLGQFQDDFDEFAEEEEIMYEDEDQVIAEESPDIQDQPNTLNITKKQDRLIQDSDNKGILETNSEEALQTENTANQSSSNMIKKLQNDPSSSVNSLETKQPAQSSSSHQDSTIGDILDHSKNSNHKNMPIPNDADLIPKAPNPFDPVQPSIISSSKSSKPVINQKNLK